jgi:penicillin-binding protein-related factor A (putative recombinase)
MSRVLGAFGVSVRRGGSLEQAILKASRVYRKEGRKLVLVKQEPRLAGGQVVGSAPVDFGGCLDERALWIEAKTSKGKSLPVSRLRDDQISLMGLLHNAGADVRLVVYFSDVDDCYSAAWPEVVTFLALRWRESWPLAWFRAEGQLLAQEGDGDKQPWLVRFLDGAEHPQRAAALAELERDKAKPRRLTEQEEDDCPIDKPPQCTPEERRLAVIAAAQEGARRQQKKTSWGGR